MNSIEYFDLYGIQAFDIDLAKDIVEKQLGIEMQGHDSGYLGCYYCLDVDRQRSIAIYENINHEYDSDSEDAILESEFPMMRIIMRVNGFSLADADRHKSSLLLCQQIVFLRRRQWPKESAGK
jgi:hypothetical protein